VRGALGAARLSALGASPGQLAVIGGTAAAHVAVGFVPLFGGPGYEAALALGLILPLPIAGLAAAHAFASARAGGQPLGALASAVVLALLAGVVHLAILLLHGARVGFCAPLEGVLLFALGPASGAVLAAMWGCLAGLAVSGRGRRVLALGLAALGPLGAIAVSLGRFWTSPMVFAFDPFAGFFAGTLYDTVIDAIPRLLTYRAGSAASAIAALAACAAATVSPAGRIAFPPERRGWLGLGLFALGLSALLTAFGPQLGHYQTTRSIREQLGHVLRSERCDVVYSSGILPERARLLGDECDAHIRSHESYFETVLAERVTVFMFASAEQKGALMGASNTYIAKPWRKEVYIQSDNYPHPVLGHELAHVVAGSFGRGPLAVAGPLGGWLPDPGRIEGFAVAASPPEDSDYSLLEWTKAMRELGLLPPLASIFKLSFLGQNSSTGYTVAGAVVDWLRTRYGPAALRAWYGGAPVESAFGGASLAALARELDAELDRVEISDRLREVARARFDRPAIFGRRCPHVVDELLGTAGYAFEAFDVEKAETVYTDALSLDPSNFNARLGLAACAERAGPEAAAEARYRALADDPALSRVQRSAVLERLADRALLDGRDGDATRLYDEAEAYAFDEHRARTIAVKRLAAAEQRGRSALVALLLGDPQLGSDLPLAMSELGEWSAAVPEDGLADYLIGKNLYNRARWNDARVRLEEALKRNVVLPSVRREALRTLVFAACASGVLQSADRALSEYLADPALSLARKNGMQRIASSCRSSLTPGL
jgi:hypothetical protein